MKAATGELNLTLITIIALGAVLAFFWFLWPTIKEQISNTWGSNTGQTEVSMWEMSNRMDSYIEDVEKGYLKDINELVNRIITEKY